MLELNKIYQGDCLEIMKQIPDKSIDLVLTDPPYGLNKKIHDGGTWSTAKKYDSTLIWDFRITKEYFEQIFRISKYQVIWGGNYYTDTLPIARCWLAWIKPHFPTMSELDLAWTNFDKPAKVYHLPRVNPSIHPTQKPLKLISKILNDYSKETDTVLDPFLGSGTTAVACEQLGRKWIGIEISPEYCKIAEQRIKREQSQFKMDLK
jgi:site-specific DNA-methyltransferase (adenine-specific)